MAVDDAVLDRRDPGVARRLSPRELRVELAMAAVFAVAAVAMLAGTQGEWDSAWSALLLTATYAVVSRISFQLGPGLVGATQLVFVPLLFLVPPLAVPALVATGAILGVVPELLLKRAHPERALVAVADSWYALGPAVVFSLLDPGGPGWEDVGVYALALAAQFGTDFAATTTRERLGAGIEVAELIPVLGLVYVVDLLLSPIGFLAVLASEQHPYAYLLAVPPGALLALVADERRKRLDRELDLGRAYRRSIKDLQRARMRVGEAVASTSDRASLERVLLATMVEAMDAECGRVSSRTGTGELAERLRTGHLEPYEDALRKAEAAAPVTQETAAGGAVAVATALGAGVLAVARAARSFSAAEVEVLEHLAAQAAVSLENLRLHEAERAAADAIRELSTPVLAVRERLLIVPLVGSLDEGRARQLTDELLARIRSGRAQVVVIDVTGVPVIDTAVANQLVQTVDACRLMGARVVVTGISSEITQALVTAGVDLRAVRTVADLQRGIEEAERLLDAR